MYCPLPVASARTCWAMKVAWMVAVSPSTVTRRLPARCWVASSGSRNATAVCDRHRAADHGPYAGIDVAAPPLLGGVRGAGLAGRATVVDGGLPPRGWGG